MPSTNLRKSAPLQPPFNPFSSPTAYPYRVRALRLLRNAMSAPSQAISLPTSLVDALYRMRAHSGMCSSATLSGPSIPGQASFDISHLRRSTMLRPWTPNLIVVKMPFFFQVYSGHHSGSISVAFIASSSNEATRIAYSTRVRA